VEENEKKQQRKPFKWDFSILIAMIAVLISTLSAYISFKESKILMQQQKIALSQQETSAWPYLQNIPANNFKGDTIAIFIYSVENKGIGPAIINEVIYKFDNKEISNSSLGRELVEKYDSLLKIRQIQNAALNQVVLAPGEIHNVVTIKISKNKKSDLNLQSIVNEIGELYVLEYCYCSVYGKCWKVNRYDDIKQSDQCKPMEGIR